MKRVLFPIGILAGAIAIAVILVRTPTQVEDTSPEIQPVTVRVAEAQLESVRLTVESQGKVQPAQQANLSTAVAGAVEWISPVMEAGGYVEQGELLMRLEASDYETARTRSVAALNQARAEADHAENELDRIRELAQQRLASESQLQGAEREASVTAARLLEAEASHQQAGLDLQRTAVYAPFNAIIASRDVELGQYVNRAESVAILYGADVVEVRVPLAIRQLGFLDISLGMRGEIPEQEAPDVVLKGVYGGMELTWPGKLVRTEAAIDANSNTVQAIIRVRQPVSSEYSQTARKKEIPLPIGLFVEATIAGRYVEDIVVLPRAAIRNNNQVLVVDAENKMFYREVEIFRLEEDRVLIAAGVRPGELICMSPIQAVIDGMSVQPVRELI